MKITFYSILSVIAFTTTAYADLSYFSKPQADQIFALGSAIEFQIDDMPNEDDVVLRANLYTEKGRLNTVSRFVSLVREWKSDDIPESCSFFWQIPGNFTAGRYFVELDQTTTEKDDMGCKDNKDNHDGEEEEEDDEDDEDEDEDEEDDDDNDKEEDGERVMSHVFVIQALVTPTSNSTGTTTGTTASSTTRTSSSSKAGGYRTSDSTKERTSRKPSESTSGKTVPFRTVDNSIYDNTFNTARIPLLAKLASTSKSKSSSRTATVASSRKKIVDKRTAQLNYSLRRRFY
ncbi:hypothetical protein EC973_008322 [Apophysomyces ossiformis]|uniref:Uncharacterized protein n=1 Tax=Apophysomyces ossiformis TaxID=679940 RepID=A0A8H7BVU2_9FUNG|nr:hypothetical protein EC973_008322 [Apophysomyces ossiformis]